MPHVDFVHHHSPPPVRPPPPADLQGIAPLTEDAINRALTRASYTEDEACEIIDDTVLDAVREFRDDEVPLCADPYEYAALCEEAEWAKAKAAVAAAGFDPVEWRDVIFDALQDAHDLETTATMVAFTGGGNGEELAMAHAYATYKPAPPPAKRLPDCGMRMRRGRAPRARSNHRRRGSSRTTRGSPTSDPDYRTYT